MADPAGIDSFHETNDQKQDHVMSINLRKNSICGLAAIRWQDSGTIVSLPPEMEARR